MRSPVVSCCRWCGADLAPRRGVRVWCDDGCRDMYRRRLGSLEYTGPVALVEGCGGACRLDGQTTTYPGPLLWPGAHATAAKVVAALTHGHDVVVLVEASDVGGYVHSADDGAFRMPTRARMAVGS